MHLFIKYSIFHNFWPKFGPRFWDIFSISGNALYESLLQHCNILRKSEKRFCEALRIRCTFSLKIQFFIIFGLTLVPDFEIFSQFQEMRFYESLLQHRNILRKSEKRFCEALWIRCNFSLNIQFFIIFGLTLGPDFEIFSQFQEMFFMNHFFSIVISCEKTKNDSVRFCGSDAPFH